MVSKSKRNRSNPLSRKRLLLSMVLVVLLVYTVVFLLVSVFSISSPYRVELLPYDFSVKDNIGVNVDVDSLHFGGGPRGVVLQRSLSLVADRDSKVSISWDGPGNLSVSKNDFFVSRGQEDSVTFYLLVPKGIPYGNYTGNITLSFFKP